jgi:predicted nucleic acid-binding protein
MKSYFDTSALLPALVTAHPEHERCKRTFENALSQGEIVCLSMHVFAELYANLTRFPLGKKISPELAKETLIALGKTVSTIDLTRSDYEAALQRCARLGSGIIYDALHLQAAIKARAKVLYTANLRDFQRLADENLPFEIKQAS